MSTLALLETVRSYGIELTADGDQLRYRAPKGIMTPGLFAQIQEHKAEILALLQDASKALLGTVGRHGTPCPQCGDTWQWPTVAGEWICSWCVAGRPDLPQVAPVGVRDTSHTAP